MQTFKHGNVTIVCDDSARFHAERDGVKFEAGSLAGIKKKLDAKPDVEPFDALDTCYGEHSKCRVIGVVKKAGRRHAWVDDHWRLDNGNERRYVYIDTSEARALLAKEKATRARHEQVRKEHEAELRDIAVKLEKFKRTPPKRSR